MNRPPETETPGAGVETGPGVERETGVEASFGGDDNSMAETAQTSNVIPFPSLHGILKKPAWQVEVIEIIHWFGLGFNEFWIAAAGPWREPPDMVRGGRHPWVRQAVFPHTEPAEAAHYAREMSRLLAVPIIDLAGILDTPYRVEGPDNGGAAA